MSYYVELKEVKDGCNDIVITPSLLGLLLKLVINSHKPKEEDDEC